MATSAALPSDADADADADAVLRTRLATLEAAQQAWRAEQQRLRLRIQDLEQLLRARSGGREPGVPGVGMLSLFGDPAGTCTEFCVWGHTLLNGGRNGDSTEEG